MSYDVVQAGPRTWVRAGVRTGVHDVCSGDGPTFLRRARTVSFTGITGVSEQDSAVQESMGRIVDRTQEHLGTSDTAVIAARRLLLNEARALASDLTGVAHHTWKRCWPATANAPGYGWVTARTRL